MKTTLSYVLTALLAFAAAFFYFKTKEPVKIPDPPKKDIKTYAITEFFKLNTKALIDSIPLKGALKKNIADYISLDVIQAGLENDYNNNFCANVQNCNLDPISLLSDGCVTCTICCTKPLFGEDVINPPFRTFNILAFKNMSPIFFAKGQEVKMTVKEVGKMQVFEISTKQRIDSINATINGQQYQLSFK